MTENLTKEQIEDALKAQLEDAYMIGYQSGLKSVLPHLEVIKENMVNLFADISNFLESKQTPEEFTKQVLEELDNNNEQ